jgi:RNase H-fold protein (predicted Holliday junction resolvase)
MITVMGIDPGIKNVGIAIIEYPQRRLVYANSVELDGSKARMVDLSNMLKHEDKPILIAIEEPFAGRNIRDYGATKEVVGAIKLLAMRWLPDVPIYMTTPQSGNIWLGIHEIKNKTDKVKREAAHVLFPGVPEFPFEWVANGHEASALGAAMAGWAKYCIEVLEPMMEVEDD